MLLLCSFNSTETGCFLTFMLQCPPLYTAVTGTATCEETLEACEVFSLTEAATLPADHLTSRVAAADRALLQGDSPNHESGSFKRGLVSFFFFFGGW